jgi:hypothetical protein
MDKRELILKRLLQALSDIPGVESAFRNRGQFPDEKRPAIALLDGVEQVVRAGAGVSRGHVRQPPVIVELQPQIFVLLKSRDTVANAGVGEELSDWRVKVIKAITTDQPLIDLLGSNGGTVYRGSQTDMQTGRSMDGELQLNFGFSYVLNPSDL